MSGKHPLGNWITNDKGYPKFKSGPFRDKYVHRVIFAQVAGRPIRDGFHVHHQGSKLCFCPHMLVECPPEFNPRTPLRDPYSGQFLDRDSYQRRYD